MPLKALLGSQGSAYPCGDSDWSLPPTAGLGAARACRHSLSCKSSRLTWSSVHVNTRRALLGVTQLPPTTSPGKACSELFHSLGGFHLHFHLSCHLSCHLSIHLSIHLSFHPWQGVLRVASFSVLLTLHRIKKKIPEMSLNYAAQGHAAKCENRSNQDVAC